MANLLFYSQTDDPEAWRAAIQAAGPEIAVRVWPDEVDDPAAIDAALVWKPPPGFVARFANLRLIQSLGAGVDALVGDATLPDVPVARLVDPMLTQCMTEYVVLQALYHHRAMATFRAKQQAADWWQWVAPPATERTVGILGLGELGRDAAAKLVTLGFRVRGWSRRPRDVADVETYHGAEGLEAMLAGADILVCLLPLTADTENILNAGLIARLPRGAALINCARGGHLVEEDLIPALESGQLSGASLDVFRTEPLPADHPFWARDDIAITPHVASITYPPTAARLVVENVRRAMAGETPLHLVDRTTGY